MAIFVCDQTRNSEGRKEMGIENFLMASREKRKENLLLRTRTKKQRKFVENYLKSEILGETWLIQRWIIL